MFNTINKTVKFCIAGALCALILSSCSTESPTSDKFLQNNAGIHSSSSVQITDPIDSSFINVGDSVIIRAAVVDSMSDSSGSSNNTVAFFVNNVLVGQDSAAPFNCTWNASAAGNYSLRAVVYSASGNVDTSAIVNVVVGIRQYAPLVNIYQPNNNAVVFKGDTVKIIATASATDSQESVSKVIFYKNGIELGIDKVAPYTFAWYDTSCGIFTLTAKVFDSKGDSALSEAVVITRRDGFIVLSSPVDNQTFQYGETVTISASAGGKKFHTVKNVKFYRNNTLITTIKAAPYKYVWKNAAVGTFNVKAIALDTKGNSDTSVTAAIHIKKILPEVNIGEPSDNSLVKVGSTVTISAKAYTTDSSVSIRYVKIYRNNKLLTTDYSAPYTCTWKNAAIGVYKLTAVACSNYGILGYSDTVKVSVVSKIPAITITFPDSNDIFLPTDSIFVQTSLTDLSGVMQVVFRVDSGNIAVIDSVAPYTAILTGLLPGYHVIQAVALASGTEYASSPVNIYIQGFQAPSVSITNPIDSSVFFSGQSITIQADAFVANGSIAQVKFYSDSAFIGADSTIPYSYIWENPVSGNYVLHATATDSNGIIGSSRGVPIFVQ